jgi:CRP-like cAMP-binding protein
MFGELGILMNKPRSATIMCKEDTDLAVLDSNYYIQTLKDAELRNIENRIAYFTKNFF